MPSKIALATSVTSARVGDGAVTIDSSIWVAVITGTPNSTQRPMIDLLQVGHVLERAVDAEVAAGDHDRVGLVEDLVEVGERRGGLDLGDQLAPDRRPRRPPRACRRRARTNDTAMKSTPAAAACSASTRSSSVGVVSRIRSDGRCTPGRPCVRPAGLDQRLGLVGPDGDDAQADRTVADDQPVADRAGRRAASGSRRRSRRPCSSRRRGAAARSSRRRATRRLRGSARPGSSGPGRSASTPIGRPSSAAHGTHLGQPRGVLLERAVAEVEPHDVDAGVAATGRASSSPSHAGPSVATIFVRRDIPAYLVDVDPVDDLRAFLDGSPSPHHAAATVATRLLDAGFAEVELGAAWTDLPGGGVRGRGRQRRRLALTCRRRRGHPVPARRRPHRLAVPAREAATRRRQRRLEAAQRRGLRRDPQQLVARPRSRRRRRADDGRRQHAAGRRPPRRGAGAAAGRASRPQRERRAQARPAAAPAPGVGCRPCRRRRVRGVDRRARPAATSRRSGTCACTTCSRRQ